MLALQWLTQRQHTDVVLLNAILQVDEVRLKFSEFDYDGKNASAFFVSASIMHSAVASGSP